MDNRDCDYMCEIPLFGRTFFSQQSYTVGLVTYDVGNSVFLRERDHSAFGHRF